MSESDAAEADGMSSWKEEEEELERSEKALLRMSSRLSRELFLARHRLGNEESAGDVSVLVFFAAWFAWTKRKRRRKGNKEL